MTSVSGGTMKCCTCFKSIRNYQSLDQTIKQSGNTETETTTTTYEDILHYLLKFKATLDEDHLISQKICNKCASLLKSVYAFIVKVHELNEERRADLIMDNGDCMKETLIEMPPVSNDDMLIKMEMEQSIDESGNHEKNLFSLNFDQELNKIQYEEGDAKDIYMLQKEECSNANEHLEVSLQVDEMPRKVGDNEKSFFNIEDPNFQIKKENSSETNLKSNDANDKQEAKTKKTTKAKYKTNERPKSKSQDNGETSAPVPNDLPRRCNICDKVYDNATALRTHKKYTHMPDERKMSCPLCSFKSSRNSNLKVHLRKVHKLDSVSQYLTTRKYNQKIKRKSLQKHIMDGKTKRDLYAETCLCTFCGKSFSSKYFLKTHVRRHTGERPYKCDLCEKSFTRNDELRSHRVIHSDEKPHQCKQCDKSFKRPDKLRTHMRVHSENRPYKCSECEKTFKYAHVLKTHMYIHTGQRPFQCASCGESFSLRTSFNLHCSKYNHSKFLDNTL